MTAEAWATLITSVVVPLLLRIVVHYFPWLAEGVTPPSPQHARGPASRAAPPDDADGA